MSKSSLSSFVAGRIIDLSFKAAEMLDIVNTGTVHVKIEAIQIVTEDKKTGTAVLICPGGGYWNLYWQLEGEEVASWLNSLGVTGIILTKLDGTSKGGAVLSIKKQLGVPVRFVGTGEQIDDFALFDPVAFVEGLLGD